MYNVKLYYLINDGSSLIKYCICFGQVFIEFPSLVFSVRFYLFYLIIWPFLLFPFTYTIGSLSFFVYSQSDLFLFFYLYISFWLSSFFIAFLHSSRHSFLGCLFSCCIASVAAFSNEVLICCHSVLIS